MGSAFRRVRKWRILQTLERGAQVGPPKKTNFHNYITPFPLSSNTPHFLSEVSTTEGTYLFHRDGKSYRKRVSWAPITAAHLLAKYPPSLSFLLVPCSSPPLLSPISVHPLPLCPGSWLHCRAVVFCHVGIVGIRPHTIGRGPQERKVQGRELEI